MDEPCPFTKVYTRDEVIDLFVRWGLVEITEDEDSQTPE
jgi:hypothetical protein